MRARYVLHFIEPDSPAVSPLCGDWDGHTDWTTYPGIVTCAACVARFPDRRAAQRRAARAAAPGPAAHAS